MLAAPPLSHKFRGWTLDETFVSKPGMMAVLAREIVGEDGNLAVSLSYAANSYADLMEFRGLLMSVYEAETVERGFARGCEEEMVRAGAVMLIEEGTPVHIIRFSVVDAMKDGDLTPLVIARVKIMEGPHKGKTLKTLSEFVVRLKPPSIGPNTLLKAAQNLDRAGKTPGAIEHYRRVVASYPGTPQAATASARIKALSPGP